MYLPSMSAIFTIVDFDYLSLNLRKNCANHAKSPTYLINWHLNEFSHYLLY